MPLDGTIAHSDPILRRLDLADRVLSDESKWHKGDFCDNEFSQFCILGAAFHDVVMEGKDDKVVANRLAASLDFWHLRKYLDTCANARGFVGVASLNDHDSTAFEALKGFIADCRKERLAEILEGALEPVA